MFSSMVGCMRSLFVVHDTMIGDVTKDTQQFISQGSSDAQIRTDRVA